MIKKSEINRLATEQQIRTSTIDKDWALGHFIDAIFSLEECRKNLIFKGGTCLRKCRFPDYRFSEDLDFTATNPSFVFSEQIIKNICSIVSERTEMPLFIDSYDLLQSNDKPTGYATHIKFWGSDHRIDQQIPDPSRWTTSVKIEVITYEKLCFEPQICEITHPYSDSLSGNAAQVPCYTIEEVLAEKLRALIQRSYSAPRDYYDIWYLSSFCEGIDWKSVIETFHKKVAYKELIFGGVESMMNPQIEKIISKAWQNSLGHQIPESKLPSFEEVGVHIKNLLNELSSRVFTPSL